MKHFSHILLRTPLQSLADAMTFNTALKPVFEEGLYLSSPDFWKELKRDSGKEKDKLKLQQSFSKYWLRSCSRSTPYGTFAGTAMSAVADGDTQLVLEDNATHIRKVRLDMNYLSGIINALAQLPEIQDQVLFYRNNSLYELPDGFRYAEYRIRNNTRYYELISIEKTTYLQAILEQASSGATLKTLTDLLVTEEEVSEEEARAFITNMWSSQLLLSGLEPCITGEDPLNGLIRQLEGMEHVAAITAKLKHIQTLVQQPEEGVAYYQQIEQALSDLDPDLNIPGNKIQTDLFLNTRQNTVNAQLIAAITKQAEDLRALSRANRNSNLENFKTKFYNRYEEAEVPLVIALDADLGLGYAAVQDELSGGSELIDGLALQGNREQQSFVFDYILQFVQAKYFAWKADETGTINITEAELDKLRKQVQSHRFPSSMYIMGSLFKENGQLDAAHFSFDLTGYGGPSAANLLGRFTYGDEQLCALTRDMLKKEEEEHPDAIYAEVVHLPQARVGNILLRPLLRGYEIPYVGRSGAAATEQIGIDDLMLSIASDEVVLRSKKHNRRVIPRLSTAHNFAMNSLPVYQFLCDLQAQGIAQANVWDWGTLGTRKHLPRVTYKNLILKKARWKIEETDVADLPENGHGLNDYFKTFRSARQMPQRVVYIEGDNELLIDFEEERCVTLLLHYLKRHKNIELEEFLFTPENCIVTDLHQKPYTNEIIIALGHDVDGAADTSKDKEEKKREDRFGNDTYDYYNKEIKRNFSLYSEWLYFKVYCGSKTAEKVLQNTVLPFIEEGLQNQLFEKFFFIRYKDEFPHFRIRFYNRNADTQLNVQKTFMICLEPLLTDGTLQKVTLDSYSREIERYGTDLIEEAESLFFNDSLCVLRFIHLLQDNSDEPYRLLFAMRGIDMLLSDFGLDLQRKSALLSKLQSGFFREFGGQPALQKQLNDRYRQQQAFISRHFNPENDTENGIDEAVELFHIRSEMNIKVVAEIQKKLEQELDDQRLFHLLSSYIHMFMNRLFISQQRKYELLVNHFLERYYQSQIAIKNKKQ